MNQPIDDGKLIIEFTNHDDQALPIITRESIINQPSTSINAPAL